MNLDENWEQDLTIDYLFEAESSKRKIEGCEKLLTELKEPSLLNQNDNLDVYRFAYISNRDHPVAIRLEHDGKTYNLFYKVGRGIGFEPREINEQKRKKISERDWKTFVQLLIYADYQNLKNENDKSIVDGQRWIIEHRSQDKYFAKSTNYPSPEFKNACKYLLRLADVKIRE